MSAKVIVGTLTFDENPASSTNTDSRLDFGDGFLISGEAPRETFTFFVTIAAANKATYKTRIEELYDELYDQDRAVTAYYDSSNVFRAYTPGTNCVSVEVIQITETGDTAGRIAVTCQAHMYIPAAVAGITGLQDTVSYGIQGDGRGNYIVEARAKFKRTAAGVSARDNAAAWRLTWFTGTGKPSWINRTIKEHASSPVFAHEYGDNECECVLTFYTVKQANLDIGTLPTYVESIAYSVQRESSVVTYSAESGSKPNAPSLLTVTGAITFRLDTDTTFATDDTSPTTHGTWAEIVSLCNRIAVKARARVDRGSASVIGSASVKLSESGNAAEFTAQFLADSQVLSYDETIEYSERSLVSHIPIDDGTYVHFDGPIKATYNGVQEWTCVSLGTEAKPKAPAGFYEKPEATVYRPKVIREYNPVTGSNVTKYAYFLRRELWAERPHKYAEIK